MRLKKGRLKDRGRGRKHYQLLDDVKIDGAVRKNMEGRPALRQH